MRRSARRRDSSSSRRAAFGPELCGVQEGDDQRVRLRCRGCELRQEGGCEEEAVIGEFDDPGCAVLGDAGDAQPSGVDRCLELRIQLVAAEELFLDLRAPHDAGDARAGHEPDRQPPRQTRRALGAIGHGAGDGHDQERGAVLRLVLGVRGVVDPQDVPCILYQSMLESASGRDQRPPPFPSKADRPERALHALVGTAGGDPDAIESIEQALTILGGKLRSWLPDGVDLDSECRARVPEGFERRRM